MPVASVVLVSIVVGGASVEERAAAGGVGVELPGTDELGAFEEPGSQDVRPDQIEPDEPDALEGPGGGIAVQPPRAACVSAPGCVVWSHQVTGQTLPVSVSAEVTGGFLVVARRSEATAQEEPTADVFALDVATGEQAWRSTVTSPPFEARLPLPMRPQLAIADRWVITADCGQLAGLDLADGEVGWTLPMGCPFLLHDVVAAPRVKPEILLVVVSQMAARWGSPTLDREVIALDIRSGTVRWSREAVQAALAPDGAVVLEGDGHLVGLDPATGEARWEATPAEPGPELLTVAGAILEVDGSGPAPGGRLRSAVDGQILLDGALQQQHVPMVGRTDVQRRAALVSTTEQLVLVEDGEVRRTAALPPGGCCTSSHLAGDHATVLLEDGTVVVLDLADGSVLGEHPSIRFTPHRYSTLTGRFVTAASEPLSGRAMSLQVFDAQARHLVAKLPNSQILAVLPDGDVLYVVSDEVLRISGP